jgi:hypothetical protein
MRDVFTNAPAGVVLVVAVGVGLLSHYTGDAITSNYYGAAALVFGYAIIDHLHGIRAALNRLESPRPSGLS